MSAETSSKKTESKSSTESSGDSGPTSDSGSSDSSSTKKDSAPARTTSYFSSVSTNEYRSGWEGIFGKQKSKSTRKRAAKPAQKKNGQAGKTKPKSDLSVTIDIGHADLEDELKKLLEATVRQHAKTGKTRLAKALKNNKVQWHLECRVTD